MKIGLVTLDSRIYNYGGILQEFAMQKVLNEMGHESIIIDFENKEKKYIFSVKNDIRNLTLKTIISKFTRKRKKSRSKSIDDIISVRHKAFDIFREKKLILSKSCNYNSLKNIINDIEGFVCGSDQIWNPEYVTAELFLDFVTDNRLKVIYAASIGNGELTKRQLDVFKKHINRLDFISVRESSAERILKPITDKDVEVVLDPTLLLSRDMWNTISKSRGLENYIFCYFLGDEIEKRKQVLELSKKTGLKIVTIPFVTEIYNEADDNFGDIILKDVSPDEFIGLIKDSEIVITDSFHACVFSIIYEKQFWVFGRNTNGYNMNTRIDNLMDIFGLQDRFVQDDLLYKSVSNKVNYSTNTEKFEIAKKKSFDYLKKALAK